MQQKQQQQTPSLSPSTPIIDKNVKSNYVEFHSDDSNDDDDNYSTEIETTLSSSSSSLSSFKSGFFRARKLRRISESSSLIYIDNLTNNISNDKNYVSSLASTESFKSIISKNDNATNNSYKKMSVVDNIFKNSPLRLPVEKLPGIGRAYSLRLKQNKIFYLEDIINFYEIECKSDRTDFKNRLKSLAFMRINSINKLLNLIDYYFCK